MEPVILLIGIAAIISITRIKLKTIQLERERLQLGQPSVTGRADSLKKSDAQLILQEIQQLNKRIENLETIVVSEDLALQQHNDTAEIRKQVALLAKKWKKFRHLNPSSLSHGSHFVLSQGFAVALLVVQEHNGLVDIGVIVERSFDFTNFQVISFADFFF